MFVEVIFQRFCAILQLKETSYEQIAYIMLLPSISSVYLPNIVFVANLLFTQH